MAKSDKLKELIQALGGEPPRTDSISYCLDALCGCNIGGGGGVSSWNDLEDKPFYEEVASVSIFDGDIAMQYPVGEEGDSAYFFESKLNLIDGEEYRVVMDGTINGNPFSFNDVITCNGSNLEINYKLEILKDRIVSWEYQYVFVGHLSIAKDDVTVKTLDPKYLPIEDLKMLLGIS